MYQRISRVQVMKRNLELYAMISVPLLLLITFRYVPLWFNVIAFYNYRVFGGLANSEFVGLAHFRALFSDRMFGRVFSNTLLISLYGMLWGFPFPIILSLMLNNTKRVLFKRTIQTLIYLPHFLSWVAFGTIIMNVLSPSTGIVNHLLEQLDLDSINFLGSKKYFRSILVISGIIKGAGWGTIVYLAALSQVDPNLYEAAEIDGASELRKTISITIPSIAPTIIMLFIMNLGTLVEANFQQIYVLYNPSVYKVSDVFETYIYRNGLVGGDYSYTTAMGLFQSVVTTLLVVIGNYLSRRFADYSMW